MTDSAPDTPTGSLEKHGMAVRSLFPELWDAPDETEASNDTVEDESLSSAATEKVNSTEDIIGTLLSHVTAFSTDSSKVAQMRESLEKSTTTSRSRLLNLNDFHMQQRAHRRGDLQKKKESLQELHNFHAPPPQITPTKDSRKKLQQDSKAADRAAMASYMFLRQQTGPAKKKSSKTTGTVSAECNHGQGPAAGIPHGAARKWRPSPEAVRQIIVTDVDAFYMQQHAIYLEDARKKREVLHISDRSILSPDRKSTSPRSYKKPTVDSFGFVRSASLSSLHSMDNTMDRSFEEKVEEKLGYPDSLHTGTKLFLGAHFAGCQHAADEHGQFYVDSSIIVQNTGDDEPTSSQTKDSLKNTDDTLENNAMAKEVGSPSKLVDESGVKTASAGDILVDPDIREDSDSPNAVKNDEKDRGKFILLSVELNPDTSAQNDEPAELLSELSRNEGTSGIGGVPVEDNGETLFASDGMATIEDEPIAASSVTNECETDFGDFVEGESCEEMEIKAAFPSSSKDAGSVVQHSTISVAVTYPLLTQLSQESSEKIGLISILLSDEPTEAIAESITGNPETETPFSGELNEDRLYLRTSERSTTEDSSLAETPESMESKNAADSVDTKPGVDQREISVKFVRGAVIAENNSVAGERVAPSKPADESPKKLGSAGDDVVDPDIGRESDNHNLIESIDQVGDEVTPPPVEHDPETLARDEEPPEVLPLLSELLSDESISSGSDEPVNDQELGPRSEQADGSTENLVSAQAIIVDPDTSEELDSHNAFESAKKEADNLAPPPVEHESRTMDRDEPPKVLHSLSLLDELVEDMGEVWCTTEQLEADSGDTEPKGNWQDDTDEHGGREVVAENKTETDELGPPSESEDESPEKTAAAENVTVDPDSREEDKSKSLTESVELTRDVEHDGDEPTPVEHDPCTLARKMLITTVQLEGNSGDAGPYVDQPEVSDEVMTDAVTEKLGSLSKPIDQFPKNPGPAEDIALDPDPREEFDIHNLSETKGQDGEEDTSSPVEHDPGTSAQNHESSEVHPSLPDLLPDESIVIDGMADESVEHDGEVPVPREQLEAGDGDVGCKIDQRVVLHKTVASEIAAVKKECHADYVNEDRTSSVSEEDASVGFDGCQDEDAVEQSDLSLNDDMAAQDKRVDDWHCEPPTAESLRFHSLRHGDENEGSATRNEEEVDAEDVNEVRMATVDISTIPAAVEGPEDTAVGQDAEATAIVLTSESDASDATNSENTEGVATTDELVTKNAASSDLNTDTDESICKPDESILNDQAVNDQITILVMDNDGNDSENAAASDEKVMVTEKSGKTFDLPNIVDKSLSPTLKCSSRVADTFDSDTLLIAELPADEPALITLKESPRVSPDLRTIELDINEEMSSQFDNHIENTSMDQAMEDTNMVISDDIILASQGKPAHDEFIEIVNSDSQSHPSTDGDLDEMNVTEPNPSNIHIPIVGSTDVAAEPVVEVDYKSADYRGFVFVVHQTHGLMLLHCTAKKEKGPHFQLPGGHVDEHEFLAAAESSRDAQTQLLLAARAGAARGLYEETGMDLRYQLDRLEPAALRSDVTFDKHGKPTLKCELKDCLYFFLPVSDEDFWSTETGSSEVSRALHPLCAEGKHLMLKISIEHSGWTFEKNPNRSVELLAVHSGGTGATALRMSMAREGTGVEEVQSNDEQEGDEQHSEVAKAEKENPQEAARASTPVDLLSPPGTNIFANLFACCNWSPASDE